MSAQTTKTKAGGTKKPAAKKPDAKKAASQSAAPKKASGETPRLFMMLFEATAGAKTGLRMGARHAIAVFMVATTREIAAAKAFKGLEMTGWSGMQIKHGMDITGQKRLKDPALDRMARKAIEKGAGFLVYKNELKGQA
ncbi:hypothetical protein [Celeribacter persicus]|uniref:Uncharacterized protein n=1 Tax=Celeribacter persicus TaxID=1651082 RepID=A0A2T5HK49_9RHOB|nr:hypothetical protein [Celeribacter persicus]PTQ71909.1 hypothetical protein C8N42_10788 [Celeribacter persicus]